MLSGRFFTAIESATAWGNAHYLCVYDTDRRATLSRYYVGPFPETHWEKVIDVVDFYRLIGEGKEDILAKFADNACPYCRGEGYTMEGGDWVPYGSSGAYLPDELHPCACLNEQAAMDAGLPLRERYTLPGRKEEY